MAHILNTCGPHIYTNDGRVVSNFFVRAPRNEPITLCRDGTQTDLFYYADNLIKGLARPMNSDDGFTGPVDLGKSDEFSMIELAEKVKTLTAPHSELVQKRLPTDDPKQSQPDIALAREQFGWEPTVKLEKGAQANDCVL